MRIKHSWPLLLVIVMLTAGMGISIAQIPFGTGASSSGGGGGGGSGVVAPGVVGDVPLYTGTTTVGDTGVLWPPRLDQLTAPMLGNYSGGGFFALLDQGNYFLLNAPINFGENGAQLTNLTSPRVVTSAVCPVENDGSSTIATVGAGFVTLNTPLSGQPDALTALNDTT